MQLGLLAFVLGNDTCLFVTVPAALYFCQQFSLNLNLEQPFSSFLAYIAEDCIRLAGYPLEVHEVVTEDGYVPFQEGGKESV